jgi:hypothetical protein
VRGELCRHFIGLPDIHLIAARAVVVDVGYTIDPGGLWALAVAVAGTVGCAGGVQTRAATSGGHLGQVERAVHAAGKVADIDGEGELLVEQLQEVVVFTSRSQQIHTRRDASLSTIDIQILVERHRVAADRDAVLGVVVNTLDGAVPGTSLSIGADGLVWEASRVLTGGASLDVLNRVGQGIEHDRCLLGHTSMAGGAELGRQLWVDLRSLAYLLGSGDCDQTRKSKDGRHCCEAMVMLMLRVAHHSSGELSSYTAMSPSYLHHIPHNAGLPQVEMRRRGPEWSSAACCLLHSSIRKSMRCSSVWLEQAFGTPLPEDFR